MNYLLLVLSIFCNSLKSVYAKKSNAYITENHNTYTYNFYMFLVAFVVVLLLGIPSWNGVSVQTLILAALYGTLLTLGQFFLIKAMNVGTVSASSLVYACGFLIPIIASVFIYNESISLMQIIGILLIILAFVITMEQRGNTSAKWFLLAFISFLCNGSVSFIQKVFRASEFGYQHSAFMTIALFTGTVVSFLLMPKGNFSLPSKIFLKTASVSGITLGLTNTINVYILATLPTVIVFPSVNGGNIVFAAILARILIKEKISLRKKAAIVLGCVAIFVISL